MYQANSWETVEGPGRFVSEIKKGKDVKLSKRNKLNPTNEEKKATLKWDAKIIKYKCTKV